MAAPELTTNNTYQPTVFEISLNTTVQQPNIFAGTAQLVWPPSATGGPSQQFVVPTLQQAARSSNYELFHHISAMPRYQNYSPEELRLIDYTNDTILSKLHCGLVLALFQGITLPPPPPINIARTRQTYGGDIITFEVGKQEEGKTTPKRFVIHSSLILHRSEFTRLALSKDWKEARSLTIPLPLDDPQIFEIYQLFLYDRDIYLTQTSPDDQQQHSNDNSIHQFQHLVQAYILGEKLLDTGFKNAIIDALIIHLRRTSYFDPTLTNLIYDNTPESSPLRRLLRDIYVHTGSAKWFNERDLAEPINADFMRDVNEGQFLARQGGGCEGPPFLNDCVGWGTYHERVETEEERKERKSITPKGWKVQVW